LLKLLQVHLLAFCLKVIEEVAKDLVTSNLFWLLGHSATIERVCGRFVRFGGARGETFGPLAEELHILAVAAFIKVRLPLLHIATCRAV